VTGTAAAASLAEMLDERRHLLEVATWMFSETLADLIVHETYRRWYALDDEERADITAAGAWLTRVTGGICLDLLAATADGETVFGDPATADRPDTTDDLVVPGGPVRRRKSRGNPDPIASWLERHTQRDHSDRALLARHDHVVRRFATACAAGDMATLKVVLAEDAMVVSDGGGKVRAAVEPIRGGDTVAHFVMELLAGRPRIVITAESVNGRTGLMLRAAGRVVAMISVSVADGTITALWIVMNPDKLRRWQLP
jgi:RNA polymerase sigma-70 factor (ECF subfamily)